MDHTSALSPTATPSNAPASWSTSGTADDREEQLLLAQHSAASSNLRYSATQPVQLDGWLSKEGKALRSRRTRFLRLNTHILSSHRSKSAAASWQISVADAIVERGPSHPREIRLSLPHRSISLIAPSQLEFDAWIVALRRASVVSSRVDDYYAIGRLIGEGMNGQVRLAHDMLTNETVAVKMVPRLGRENETQFLAREVQIILSISHPNIVNTVDIFVTRRRIHFVLEYLAGGELFDFIAENNHFTEVHAATVMTDLLNALSYLHSRGIAHRDVKLENLLCSNSSWPLDVKLADFGFANYVNSGNEPMLSSFVGTPYYIAPEMIRADPHGRPVDIWASGVVMYILLSGKFPFGGKNEAEYYQRVLNKEAYFPTQEWTNVSEDAKDLVRGMLCKDPTKRLTADQCLQHRWFKRSEHTREIRQPESVPRDPPAPTSIWRDMNLPSPRMFRTTREKRGRWRYRSMLNHSLPQSSTPKTPPQDPPVTQQRHSSAQNLEHRRRQRTSESTTPVDEESRSNANPINNMEDVHLINRRPSLIRRLLSSGKLSLDRYDGRFPSFRGNVEEADEASATPRKTMSLFSKDGPLRRSFHRGGERASENSRPSSTSATANATAANTPIDPGVNFVNSQSQRLPPKVARERQRQQKEQSDMSRRTGGGAGMFYATWRNGSQSGRRLRPVSHRRRSERGGEVSASSGYFSQHPHLHESDTSEASRSNVQSVEVNVPDPQTTAPSSAPHITHHHQSYQHPPQPSKSRELNRHEAGGRGYHSSPKLQVHVPSFNGISIRTLRGRSRWKTFGSAKSDKGLGSAHADSAKSVTVEPHATAVMQRRESQQAGAEGEISSRRATYIQSTPGGRAVKVTKVSRRDESGQVKTR